MAVVVWRTANLGGRSAINCRRCNTRIEFPTGKQLISIDNGYTVRAFDVADLGTLHRCGREVYWWCDHCGHELELDDVVIPRPTRRPVKNRGPMHDLCREPVRQRERRAARPS